MAQNYRNVLSVLSNPSTDELKSIVITLAKEVVLRERIIKEKNEYIEASLQRMGMLFASNLSVAPAITLDDKHRALGYLVYMTELWERYITRSHQPADIDKSIARAFMKLNSILARYEELNRNVGQQEQKVQPEQKEGFGAPAANGAPVANGAPTASVEVPDVPVVAGEVFAADCVVYEVAVDPPSTPERRPREENPVPPPAPKKARRTDSEQN